MEPAKERIGSIIRILRREYPDSRTALHFESPLEILIATILAAQCTDERVNKVTPALFKKYKTAGDYAKADLKTFEQEIHSTGFYRNKAGTILHVCRELIRRFHSRVPESIEELLTLKGVGRKTANLVVSLGFNGAGICVDTHVHRISNRLGYVRTHTGWLNAEYRVNGNTEMLKRFIAAGSTRNSTAAEPRRSGSGCTCASTSRTSRASAARVARRGAP